MKCKQCSKNSSVNSKELCGDCVFKNNHDGKTQQQIYFERSKEKSNKIKNKETIQKRIDVLNKDKETYLKVFLSKPHICEECGVRLPDVFETEDGSIVYVHQYSHILTKGAYPEHRHNPLNFNRLCLICHQKWEFGDRTKMKISSENQKTIEKIIKKKEIEKPKAKMLQDGFYYFTINQIKRGEADNTPTSLIRVI